MRIPSQSGAKCLLTLLTLLFCISAGRAQAQSVAVTLNVADATLEQVMEEIENQTNYLFVYDKNVDVTRKVTLNAEQMPLKALLDQLFKSTNIIYAVENTSIVLSTVSEEKAPKPGSLSGVVVDASGLPVIGAAVVVKGTTIGASTGVDGSFTLQVPPSAISDAILTVNYLGYEPIEIAVGARTNFDITLTESSVKMDDVVVTALGIKRSEKALSYNAQKVSADDILAVKDVNFINALSGKVAGVTINASSAGVGGASKVVMRGPKSINQSSNALYVINGIPMYNFSKEGGQEFQSSGATEAIADINPEDIESMTVLTGAAAAALYGSEAANGAIIVNTKQGKEGRTEISVTSNTEILSPFVMPKFQNRYGTSDNTMSWGLRLNEASYMGYSPREDYFQTGVVGTETVSLSTGNDRNQTYLSVSAVNSKGIIPNNSYARYNFTFRNTTHFFKDKVKLDMGGSYILQKDRNMVNQGVYMNPLTSAYLFPRGNDWADIEMFERWDPKRKIATQYWPSGEGTYVMQNPYWVNHRNLRENDKDRYMLNAALTYNVTDYLTLSGRLQLDNTINDFTDKRYASTNLLHTEGSDNGYYGVERTKDRQVYGDVLASFTKRYGDFSVQANAGASFTDLKSDAMRVEGPIAYGLLIGYDEKQNPIYEPNNIPNIFNIQQLSNSKTMRKQSGWREQTQSVFFSGELGYKDTYFLTVTGRNDWPSQLAGPNSVSKSFFYPSVGASVVLSQIISMPENFSYLKLRSSYASVGNAFQRHLAYPTYEWTGSIWGDKNSNPMYNLKPERTKSWEVGLTARFLKHFNLDLTYYSTQTTNQTFNPISSVTSGYKNIYIQTGNVRNRGVEMLLGYNNSWRDFSWNTDYTLSINRNKILELANNVVNPVDGSIISLSHLDVGGLGQTRFILREGGTLGDLYSRADLIRDSNGDIYVDETGKIQVEAGITDINKYIKLGSVNPKANMAWRNDFKWRNLNFGFMLSARLGGVVFSRTQAALDYYGVSEASAAARDAGGVIINGSDVVDAQKWYTTIGNQDGIPQYYAYSATNIRLQEASLGYTIPRKKLANLMEITVSLVGRNLWMIYNKAPFDPEAVATTGNYYQGIDYFMMPSTRNIGFNVRLKF